MCGSEAVCGDVCVFATECNFVQLSVNVTECVSVYVAVQCGIMCVSLNVHFLVRD